MYGKKKTAISLGILTLLLSIFLTSCANEEEYPDEIVPDPALRAVAHAASSGVSSTPVILDSYTDGVKNYYLIDVGYIRNIYVSTIAEVHYNGYTPMYLSSTTVNETTITKGLTETVSNSISISDTQNHKVGIDAGWSKEFANVGKFDVKLNYSWSGTWTNSTTSTRSTATSLTEAVKHTQTDVTTFTIGANGEPAGSYRYALYGVCDVYFVVTTDLNNQELLSWDVLACVRDNSYFPHWDYSTEEPPFDNSPIDTEILFADDFYKDLPLPDSERPRPTWNGATDWETIRTETKRITDEGRFKQYYDEINFSRFNCEIFDDVRNELVKKPVDLIEMKRLGYKTISFYIRLDVSEKEDGYQYLCLYTSPVSSDNYKISDIKFEHDSGKKNDSWWTHFENELKFENVSIDKFMNNEFIIRYSASGVLGDDWENKNLIIQLSFAK